MLAAKYQPEAERQPASPVAQFRWSYTVWKNINPTSPFITKRTNSLAGFYPLIYAKSPDAYDHSRLRYLLSPTSFRLTRIGEKLLDQDANDNDVEVKVHLALDYATPDAGRYSLTAKVRAIQLSKELIASNPKYPRYCAVLAEPYRISYFLNGHHRQDGLAMIDVLKKYFRLAKPDEDFYQDAKFRMADMEQRINAN